MAFESSGMILQVAKFRNNRINGSEIDRGGPKFYTDTHTHTHTDTRTHTDTHTPAAYLISLFFFKKETRLKTPESRQIIIFNK